MNLLESQNILLVVLRIYGFFPFNFPGKFRKFKNQLYNFVLSTALVVTLSIVGVSQLSQALVSTTEKDSVLGYLTALMEVLSLILCFAIVKLYLLVKSKDQEKYFKKLRDLEIMVRSYHFKNTKINKIIEDLRKTTERQEISILGFYLFIQFCYI